MPSLTAMAVIRSTVATLITLYRHYIDTYGEGALELIREKAEDINLGKRMNKEQKLIAKHYKTEAARMENERASGYNSG